LRKEQGSKYPSPSGGKPVLYQGATWRTWRLERNGRLRVLNREGAKDAKGGFLFGD